jgi:putative ABC transport system substrate-binding protein
MMKRTWILIFSLAFVMLCCNKEDVELYTIGILQFNNAPTLNDTCRGFLEALKDQGFIDGKNIRLIIKNGNGEIPDVQKIARDFVSQKVDMIVPFSTPCFQAALHATREIPIVFSSVANPYLAGAGTAARDQLGNVSGVSSRGPIRESIEFIKRVLPEAQRIGTLWTPSELNSKYYLDLVKENAEEMGMEVIQVSITNSSAVLLAAQILVNKKIDVIYQISDNTINTSFDALGEVAEENSIPLFGGYPPFTEYGASAAMGWDFFDMGYKAGEIAVRVKNGENVKDIPFQYMSDVKIYLNLIAAEKQGIHFSEDIIEAADNIIRESPELPDI